MLVLTFYKTALLVMVSGFFLKDHTSWSFLSLVLTMFARLLWDLLQGCNFSLQSCYISDRLAGHNFSKAFARSLSFKFPQIKKKQLSVPGNTDITQEQLSSLKWRTSLIENNFCLGRGCYIMYQEFHCICNGSLWEVVCLSHILLYI